jgi:hypothetical protein
MQKPDVFAKAVVKHILSSSPNPWVYKGNVATIAWIVANFGPNWAFVSTPISNMRLGRVLSIVISGFTDEEYDWTGKVSKRDSKSSLGLLLIEQLLCNKETNQVYASRVTHYVYHDRDIA